MAANKKDFSNIDLSPVYANITEAIAEDPGQDPSGTHKRKPRKTYTEEEKAAALNSQQTTGKKGIKMPRINLAFTPDNYEFIKVMAQVRGQTQTAFINEILTIARENNADLYKKAIAFRNNFKA